MLRIRSLITVSLLIASLLAMSPTGSSAALPCNLMDSDLPAYADGEAEPGTLKPLTELFSGQVPADREGATGSDPGALRFNLVSAGENVLRCLDYGQDRVLIDNATPEFREDRFTQEQIESANELVEHAEDGSVVTEDVYNPLELSDGRFLVDFVAVHNGNRLTGEMVFMREMRDFYLDSTYLSTWTNTDGQTHKIEVTNEGVSSDSITAALGDSIDFQNKSGVDVSVVIRSNTTGEVIFTEDNIGAYTGEPAVIELYFVQDVKPENYSATITTSGADIYTVKIVIEP